MTYVQEKKSRRKWSFTDLGKRKGEKASLVDSEKNMKLCSLLICSAAGTCWTVTLVKLSKVTSGNILLTWWKVHRLLLCFDSLWGVALCLSIHEHRAASGGCCVDIILTLLSQFVWVWNSEQQGQGRTVKPGLCVPRKQHHHMGYKLLVRISNFNFLLVQNTVSYKNSSSRYLNMKHVIL